MQRRVRISPVFARSIDHQVLVRIQGDLGQAPFLRFEIMIGQGISLQIDRFSTGIVNFNLGVIVSVLIGQHGCVDSHDF